MQCATLRSTTDMDKQAKAWAALERAWKSLGRHAPHHGRMWGMDTCCGNVFTLQPFSNVTMADNVYPAAVKQAFTSEMKRWDPHAAFAAGRGPQLLGISQASFDVRGFPGDACPAYGDAACIDGCCCTSLSACGASALNTCLAVNVSRGLPCAMSWTGGSKAKNASRAAPSVLSDAAAPYFLAFPLAVAASSVLQSALLR